MLLPCRLCTNKLKQPAAHAAAHRGRRPALLWRCAGLTPSMPATPLMQASKPLLPLCLQIEMTYDSPSGTGQNYRRKYRVRALAEDGKGAAELKFKETVDGEERETTVMQYYKSHYGLDLDPR